MSKYYDNLINEVINKSVSSTWNNAIKEWEIIDCEEDDFLEYSCVCGKENLRYLYKIRNCINGNILFPIGSSCIKKFNRTELNEIISISEKMFKLYHAIENNEKIELSSVYFSRKLLLYLYNQGAFNPNCFNNFNSKNSYLFMVDMFNARNITEKQRKKTSAIILNDILPFLRKNLKIRNKNN